MAEAVLRGRVTLNDSEFSSGLRRAERHAAGFASRLRGNLTTGISSAASGLAASLVAGLSVGAFTRSISSAIQAGGALNDLSTSTGIAVGELYKLQAVFENNDQSSQQMGSSIARMQKSLIGGSKAFEELGLNSENLLRLKPSEQFQEIGRALDQMKDPAAKAAAAMQIFGRSGTQLFPVFADLRNIDLSKLNGLAAVVERNAEKFDHLSDSLADTSRTAKGFSIGIAAGLVGALENASKEINGRDFASLGERLGQLLSKGIEKGAAIGKRFEKLFPFGSYIHEKLGNPQKTEEPPDNVPVVPQAVDSGSGFGRLETFKSFTDPYGRMDAPGATKRDEGRSNDFINFFHPTTGPAGTALKPLGAYSGIGGGGVEGMSRAYETSPYAYKTSPDAYGQSGTAAAKEEEKSKPLDKADVESALDRVMSRYWGGGN